MEVQTFKLDNLFYLKNYYYYYNYYYYFIIIIFADPFYPISRPTLALLFIQSNILFTAIMGLLFVTICYHGDGSFVKRGRASHDRVPMCSL